jgi:hypothetical protein
MMVLWCGSNPALNYNGGFVLSRGRTQDGMPAEEQATIFHNAHFLLAAPLSNSASILLFLTVMKACLF